MSFVLDRPAKRPLIIAHRGYRACFPENTLLAFERSLGRCDMIELDVRLSADGAVVILHDALLDRTSDAPTVARAQGIRSLALRDWTREQLQRLDAGSWFVRVDPFGALSSGLVRPEEVLPLLPQRIPTLDQVLAWSHDHALPLNIELKDLGDDRDNRRLAEEVIARIHATESAPLVLLSSFNHPLLAHCHRRAPDLALAALQEGQHPPALLTHLRSLGVCAYHPEDAITDRPLVEMLHYAGIAVNVFTVNDRRRMRQLHDFGVTGIITDYPAPPSFWFFGRGHAVGP